MAGINWDELDPYFDPDPAPEPAADTGPDGIPASLLALKPGELVWNESGSVYVHTCAYDLTAGLQHLDFAPPAEIGLSLLADAFDLPGTLEAHTLQDCVFIDCETTGLGYTAMPFMVGVATYECLPSLSPCQPRRQPDGGFVLRANAFPASGADPAASPTHLVVRQLFALHPREESAVLQAVQELVTTRPVCVTFNGHSFDIPLLQARFRTGLFHFPELPLEDPFAQPDLISLDLLPMIRKIWRRQIGSCALGNCETRILGLHRTHADVAGSLIPGIYLRFLDHGRADDISRVFCHNRWDILAMAFLLVQLVHRVHAAAQSDVACLSGEEALALGRLMLAKRHHRHAETLLVHAIRTLTGNTSQAEAFRILGHHYKRQTDWIRAVALWERWIGTAVEACIDPYVELAKYHEWHNKELEEAEIYTRWALHVHSSLHTFSTSAQTARRALEHRLQRIQRKRNRLSRWT